MIVNPWPVRRVPCGVKLALRNQKADNGMVAGNLLCVVSLENRLLGPASMVPGGL